MHNASADFAPTDILLGASPIMQALRQRVVQAARSAAPVLLLGETGVGKELAAQALMYCAQAAAPGRPKRPFIVLNCGSLTQALAASELFGHVRGAFTGAHTGHAGAFAAADGGTLFLDEVGELPRDLQPQLLRALDHGEVRAVGAVRARQVHVRIIAATHQDLPQAVAAGRFRADLWHRLSTLVLHVPPLRERTADLHALVPALCQQMGQAEMRLTPGAWSRLHAHAWPGNVRELKNVLHRAWVFRSNDAPIDAAALDLPPAVDCPPPGPCPPAANVSRLAARERQAILAALAENHGNRRATAASLGCSRSTLYRRLGALPGATAAQG
jgi:DNA-binding NtrC family response regulator